MSENLSSIAELLLRARSGDAAALEQLIQRYREFVRLLVRGRCGQFQARVDGSDLVQETLLRVARNIDQFEGTEEEQWRAWLTRITERVVIQQLRQNVQAAKRAVGREQPLEGGNPEASSRLCQWAVSEQTSPSQAVVNQERALALSDALARLPQDYREVLALRHLEGLDFPEIAERMQRSHGAVRVLWTRALKKLREELNPPTETNGRSAHG